MNKIHFGRLLLYTCIVVLFNCANLVSQCTIADVVVTTSACDANDKFSAEINFNFSDPGASGFQILGNGNNYGTFQYDNLPIIIDGLSGNCVIEFEFIIRDIEDPSCASFYELGTVCCDDVCEISIVDFETTDCMDNEFFGISLNLEYGFQGNQGYSVTINGESFGNFSYEDLPLNIDNITSMEDGLNSFTVCDMDFPECCNTYTFLNPCVCAMSNITSSIVDCNSDDSIYFVTIDFDHIATNDSFQMGYSNGGSNIFLGTFAYNELPVTAGPIFLSEDEEEILIVDTEDFFCFNSAYLGIVDDCEIACQLYNLSGEAYMCEDGEYFMDLEFLAEDIEGSSFEVLVDGVNYGTFLYGENFYTIGPIPSNCENAPVLIVQDSEVEFCFDFYNFPEPICCLPECNFTALETTAECGTSTVTINGTFENNGFMPGAFYFVEFLGTSYGPFVYGDFTFSIEVPLLADGEYPITINDSNDPNCQISSTFIVQCEDQPCLIFDVFAEPSECEENLFFVDIEFEYAGEVSDSFEVLGNGTSYGTFAYGAPFYSIGPLEGDCETIYEFLVSDQILEGCNSFFSLAEPICCLSDCSIRDIEIVDFTCLGENTITGFTLDFIYEGSTSSMFSLIIDGINLGSYAFADLPIQFDLELSNSFVLSLQDSENSECQSTQAFELDCTDDCTITNTSLIVVDCSQELENYYLELDLEHTGTGNLVEVYANGSLIAQIEYSDLPFVLGPFSLGELYQILINDSEDSENCEISTPTLVQVCQTGLEEVSFSNIKIIQLDNFIHIHNNESEGLNFKLFNTSGSLINAINIGSNDYNSFDTSQLSHGLYVLNISNERSQKTIKVIVY